MTPEDLEALDELEFSIRAILPETYQDTYDEVQPVSMGSAGLKFGDDGKVAWNQIWGSFCDLAMAGGPPHKGVLLEPGDAPSIAAQPERYDSVTSEICRGVQLVTELPATPSSHAGWIQVTCTSAGMAGWLARAIVMENVSARARGAVLELPAGPDYRLEKEIKNVVTSVAKAAHYWIEHVPDLQQRSIGSMFARMSKELPLVEPVSLDEGFGPDQHEIECTAVADAIFVAAGLRRSSHRQYGWIGLECGKVAGAIWIMRALVVANILSRREGTVLFVPVNAALDPGGARVIEAVTRFHHLADVSGVL